MYTLVLWILSCQADVCEIVDKREIRYNDQAACLKALDEFDSKSHIGICVKDK